MKNRKIFIGYKARRVPSIGVSLENTMSSRQHPIRTVKASLLLIEIFSFIYYKILQLKINGNAELKKTPEQNEG